MEVLPREAKEQEEMMEIMSKRVIPLEEWTEEQEKLSDWVSIPFLTKKLYNGLIPCGEIPICWRKYWEKTLLEIQLARFAGNGSGLAFSFEQEELAEEYESGQPFRLPLERLRNVSGDVFGFGWLDQLSQEMPESENPEPPVSFLPGELYYTCKESPSHRHKWMVLDGQFIVTERAVFDWRRHCFATPHMLIRLHLSTEQKNYLMADADSELYRLLVREDVIRQKWTSQPEAVRSGTDIYLVLNLETSRQQGLIREELLLG